MPSTDDHGGIVVDLDELMKERGMTSTALAALVGITETNLRRLKNNRVAAVRYSTLAAICHALDCQPGDIMAYIRPADREPIA